MKYLHLVSFLGLSVILSACTQSLPDASQDQNNRLDLKSRDPLAISYESLMDLEDFSMIDIREDEERAQGYILDSEHIRFADMLSMDVSEFNPDEVIIVYCFTGSRSREVAHYLDDIGVNVYFLNERLDEISLNSLRWTGNASFPIDPEIKNELELEEVLEYQEKGVVLVDSRKKRFFDKWHVDGSISIPTLNSTSEAISSLITQVPENSDIVILCDPIQRSCFSGFITAMKLKKNGHKILGYMPDINQMR